MDHQTPSWETPGKPAELAEDRLVTAILDGSFPINSALPPERELAEMLGVTRPTLREALQRLSREGWVEIHHGKTTRVRDYWHEGNLLILTAIARHKELLDRDFVTHLLQFRLLLAPEYTRMAIEKNGGQVLELLDGLESMGQSPEEYARKDFRLHNQLTVLAGNPIFPLILNGFGDLYLEMGKIYFSNPLAREYSGNFYKQLRAAAQEGDLAKAYEVVHKVMLESIDFWKMTSQQGDYGIQER